MKLLSRFRRRTAKERPEPIEARIPSPRDWAEAPDRAAAATDIAVAALAPLGVAERTDRLADALHPPFGRGALRMALHLRGMEDLAARQAARLVLGAHAQTCKDMLRVTAEFTDFLDAPCKRSPRSTERALSGMILARVRCGETDAALALHDRRANDVPGRARRLERARILCADDPDAALAILRDRGADDGDADPAARGLEILLLLAQGDLDAAEALAWELAASPRGATLARVHLHNMSLARSRDRGSQIAAFDALGITLTEPGGFDTLRMARRDPAPDRGPLVSVVMTAFDAESHVATAITAIMEQSWRDLELIVVDDCSRDGTHARLAALAEAEPRLRVLRTQRNGGTYLAKNLGIASARGDLVALCDADDRWTPDHLAVHLAAIRDRPDVVMSMSRWLRVFEDGAIEVRPPAGIVEACPHSTLFRREVFDRVGFFDSVRIGADREMMHRVRLEYGTASVLRLDRVLTLGRRHGASLTMSGAGAITANRTPEIRQVYRNAWVGWHLAEIAAGRPLRNSGRPAERPYPVPDAMI